MDKKTKELWYKTQGIIIDDEDSDTYKAFHLLETKGLAICYDSMFGNLYYALTKKGEKEMFK